MRNLDKVLVVPSAHAWLLLPERIFPDDEGPYPLLNQKVDNGLAGSVEIVIDLTVTLRGNPLHLLRDTLSLCFGQTQLQLFHALVIPLIDGLERPTVNQARDKALSV